MKRVRVVPVRVYAWDAPLWTTVRRVVGYRAECECGWKGPKRRIPGRASWDGREHECADANAREREP